MIKKHFLLSKAIHNDKLKYRELYKSIRPLMNSVFEKELLSASLNNLFDVSNKLRFNNFACSIRELSRHILHNLSPDKEVIDCVWYKNESGNPNKLTRAERIKYAIQKGIPDEFAQSIFDVAECIDNIKDTLDTLNKYTHVNPETFNVKSSEVNKLAKEVLESFKQFARSIVEFHNNFKITLEKDIDESIFKHTIENSFDNVNILSNRHNVEQHEIFSYSIENMNAKHILINIEGDLYFSLEYGSSRSTEIDEGCTINTSFPFDCKLQITIDKDFAKNKCEIFNFKVNTDDWYE